MPVHEPDYRQKLNNELQRIGDLVNLRYEFTTIGRLHEATWRATARSERSLILGAILLTTSQYGAIPMGWAMATRNPRPKKLQHRPRITSYLQEASSSRVERPFSRAFHIGMTDRLFPQLTAANLSKPEYFIHSLLFPIAHRTFVNLIYFCNSCRILLRRLSLPEVTLNPFVRELIRYRPIYIVNEV